MTKLFTLLGQVIQHLDIDQTALDEATLQLYPWTTDTSEDPIAIQAAKSYFKKTARQTVADLGEVYSKQFADLTEASRVFNKQYEVKQIVEDYLAQARKNLQKIFQRVVDERKAEKVTKKEGHMKDMLDMFMEIESDSGVKLSDEEIVDLINALLNAGHESSAHAIMWAVMLLQENPQIFQKAKEEQQNIVMKRSPNQEGLTLKETRQMEYLSKVIDETLRLVNISFTLFREATTDVTINGYNVPKGWRILTWLRSAHLHSDNYMFSKEFIPLRWDDPKTRANFIPFGAGSRMCPGRDLAKLEIYVFLHYFLLNYKLERLNPECAIKYLPISSPIDNCLAKVVRSS
ncbi:beta-amyrin 11-oxidase-like [Silene latifolia]|uniref:beta-amyrin 11-oxidase-like n=1 Tax=Silene latifolia TaxID=37657 RepID=UPI003D777499